MDRVVLPIVGDESHTEERWRHASPAQRDARLKTFPNPMPAGFHLEYKWLDDNTLSIKPVPDVVAVDAKGEPVLFIQPETKPDKHASEGSPADLAAKAQQARAARIFELSKKHKNDLKTIAAEVGAEVSGSLSQARMADLIVAAEEANKAKAEAEAKKKVAV